MRKDKKRLVSTNGGKFIAITIGIEEWSKINYSKQSTTRSQKRETTRTQYS